MLKNLIAFVTIAQLPFAALSCPNRLQLYEGLCISQDTANFIACVIGTGRNKQEVTEQLYLASGNGSNNNFSASAGNKIVRGAGSISLDRKAEQSFAKTVTEKWFPNGTRECSKYLRGQNSKLSSALHTPTTTFGLIAPGNEPISLDWKKVPNGALGIILGKSFFVTRKFPHSVINVGPDQIVSLELNERGELSVFAKIFSENGNILAELKGNNWVVNPNNFFKTEMPNNHTLVVYDQKDTQALKIDFRNKGVVQISGTFYLSKYQLPPLLITEDSISLGSTKIGDNYFENLPTPDIEITPQVGIVRVGSVED